MKVTKWVDFGCEVEVDVSVDDITGALSEAMKETTEVLGDPPNPRQVLYAVNTCAEFFNSMTDEVLGSLTKLQRDTVVIWLRQQADRWEGKKC